MKALFNHTLIPSFYLYLDNQILDGAQGYRNITTGLYRMQDSSVNGNVWASPWKSWVADSCVSGANIISGVYNSSGQFLTRNSGIVFDYINGRVISPHNWGPLSGSFAVKDYNLYPSNHGQIKWWLDEISDKDPNLPYTITGIPAGPFAAPCILLTNTDGNNEPWALGGLEETKNTIIAYIISNTDYMQDGIDSWMRDMARESFAQVQKGDVPYTNSGDIKSGYYCYSDLCEAYGAAGIHIDEVHSIKINQRANKATKFMVSIVEFDVSTIRLPRQNK